jgi:hypothetical protein
MRNKPGNVALSILAACILSDVLVSKPKDEGDFLISIGVFGALLSRALLDEPQSVMISILGLILTVFALSRNHGIIDRTSDGWYVLALLIAVLYALWEKILNWLSL